MDVIRALRAEKASLEAELAADPRHQKIAKINELLAMYGEPGAPSERVISPRLHLPKLRVSGDRLGGRPNSLTTQVLETSIAYFQSKGARAQTSEIADICVRAGVPLPDSITKQRDYVSSILSHSPLINNIRGQGYGLAEWPVTERGEEHHGFSEPPDSAPTLSGASNLSGVLPLNIN